MSYAAESVRCGRRPTTFLEIDVDKCTLCHPAGASLCVAQISDTTAAYNENLARQSEEFDGSEWTLINGPLSTTSDTPPAGSNSVYKLENNNAGTESLLQQTISAGTMADATQHRFFAKFKEDTGVYASLRVRDTSAPTTRGEVHFQWVAGNLTVAATPVGTSGVTNLGGGWWLGYVDTTAGIVAANTHMFQIYSGRVATPADTGHILVTAAMCKIGASALEYQLTALRDGSQTNIRLTTGGLTYDAEIGKVANFSPTTYPIIDNGTNYIRVTGDATGEGLATALEIGFQCSALATDAPCFNTRSTCQDPNSYDGGGANIQTYRFSEDRLDLPPSVGAVPGLINTQTAPARITRGQGIGARERVTFTLRDHPHHDRGTDPYVALRTYDPWTQGTFWAKFRARHRYYQGRPMRVKVGYITEPLDLAANFVTHNYVLESISGPDSAGITQIVGKDVLKLADDRRAQAPAPSDGVLAADLAAGAASLTLSPTGIGSDYPSSGTVRIESEVMTYSGRTGDVLTGLSRGTDNTEDVEHSADDTVQVCLRYTAATVDDIIYDLLINYAGIPASYINTTDWADEVDTWIPGHSATTLITEPTGVLTLVSELSEQYLCDLWWDSVNQEIKLHALRPASGTVSVLTDDANIVADSFRVQDRAEDRLTEVWIYYRLIDPTQNLDEKSNYATRVVRADADAESDTQFGDVRVKRIFSRWLTENGDVIRVATRTLNSLRNVPRTYTFRLDIKDDLELGDIIDIQTGQLVDGTGAEIPTRIYILERREPTPAHQVAIRATDAAFQGRYGLIAPDATPDYDSASELEKDTYAFVAEDTAPRLNGDGAYRIV